MSKKVVQDPTRPPSALTTRTYPRPLTIQIPVKFSSRTYSSAESENTFPRRKSPPIISSPASVHSAEKSPLSFKESPILPSDDGISEISELPTASVPHKNFKTYSKKTLLPIYSKYITKIEAHKKFQKESN